MSKRPEEGLVLGPVSLRSDSEKKMAGIVELLPKEYGYVIFTLAAYYILNLYMQIQRGHQNSLESLPIFFVMMVVGGLKHPLICTGLGLGYTVTRFFYFTGYSSGDPNGRLPIGWPEQPPPVLVDLLLCKCIEDVAIDLTHVVVPSLRFVALVTNTWHLTAQQPFASIVTG
ncbi:hypothetical protein E3N88_01682 [Mikania micrantha]|uniref:Uncharacterized protein n=1 Tax=Mikania micrantha TaxID=192012 RepID=A0A5N6Q390_9ASTR|nr:hypothetical protein E3N88_01682 [Mikania micrantha]